jgi:hypothetical protein
VCCVVLATESMGREENSLSLVRLASALLTNSISELAHYNGGRLCLRLHATQSFRSWGNRVTNTKLRSVPLLHTLEGCSGSAGQEANISYIDCNDLATLPPVRIVLTKVTSAVPIGGKSWIDVTICELSNSVLPPVG